MSSSELQGGVLPAPPSFFECAAAARLVPSLKAAILYSMHTVLDSGAQGSATSLWALRSFDELVLVSQIAMEWICLRQGSASFAEGVYGLRRVPLPGNKKIKVMPSLFWLAVFPYLRTKLRTRVRETGGCSADANRNAVRRSCAAPTAAPCAVAAREPRNRRAGCRAVGASQARGQAHVRRYVPVLPRRSRGVRAQLPGGVPRRWRAFLLAVPAASWVRSRALNAKADCRGGAGGAETESGDARRSRRSRANGYANRLGGCRQRARGSHPICS
ncbi:peroxin-12 [Pycnococcus provasolii]